MRGNRPLQFVLWFLRTGASQKGVLCLPSPCLSFFILHPLFLSFCLKCVSSLFLPPALIFHPPAPRRLSPLFAYAYNLSFPLAFFSSSLIFKNSVLMKLDFRSGFQSQLWPWANCKVTWEPFDLSEPLVLHYETKLTVSTLSVHC